MGSKQIFGPEQISITIDRLCFQLSENHQDFQNTAIIGLQPRGIFLARRIHKRICEISKNKNILYGDLDIAFYRDDFRRHDHPIIPNELKINFLVEKKRVVLVDDVLYTGRTVRAALDALTGFGRPDKVELLVLIDRRYSRELPIEPGYVGKSVDTRSHEKVIVDWQEAGKKTDSVSLVTK